MTISAKVIAASENWTGIQLYTLQLRYPRIIHSEFMTHRVLSRNASSSRAIPVKRIIQMVQSDPAEPVEFGSNKPGMQAGEPLSGPRLWGTRMAWHGARHAAVMAARIANNAGAHKQVVNRILEPWSHIDVIVTGTEWSNFFKLRCHRDADPTIRELACAIRTAIAETEPARRDEGWSRYNHLPFVTEEDYRAFPDPNNSIQLALISAARCARVSYLNHLNNTKSREDDLALARQLFESGHMSPFEHQARPDLLTAKREPREAVWRNADLHGNFVGFVQFRKDLEKNHFALIG